MMLDGISGQWPLGVSNQLSVVSGQGSGIRDQLSGVEVLSEEKEIRNGDVKSFMAITKFEDLKAWQKSQQLAAEVYQNFAKLGDFPFKDQICSASVSISNNIAEGFNRRTKADVKRYMIIARGSCYEVKSMVYLSENLGYTDSSTSSSLLNSCDEVSRIITGFIKSLN